MRNQAAIYAVESQRLSLCRGLVGSWVLRQVAGEYEMPIKSLFGPFGGVEIDVERLKQAQDVSVN